MHDRAVYTISLKKSDMFALANQQPMDLMGSIEFQLLVTIVIISDVLVTNLITKLY